MRLIGVRFTMMRLQHSGKECFLRPKNTMMVKACAAGGRARADDPPEGGDPLVGRFRPHLTHGWVNRFLR